MNCHGILCISLGLLLGMASRAQGKKENAIVNVDIRQDKNVNYSIPQKSVTHGIVTVEGTRINYDAAAGTIVLKNSADTPTASIFYAAYFKDDDKDAAQRPVTFLYNGGPGSSTIWLHMGAFGPQRVSLSDTAATRPPYTTVNNDYSLLDASDLVFIDAPGTGFSKLITRVSGGAGRPEDFYGGDADANAFASFIVQFLTQYNRWTSPKYLFGESYGTFRSALLADILETEKGVSLNGVILLSQTLNIGNSPDNPHAEPGNDLPYELALPSYTAVAWYHHQLPDQPEKLEPLLKEVEHFAMNDYAQALNKGASLDADSFDQMAVKLPEYTGINIAYIRKANLRIEDGQFEHQLLLDQDMITGRLDGRFKGYSTNPLGEKSLFDPMDSYIDGPFIAAFNNYVRSELQYGRELTFYPGGAGVYEQWDYRHKIPGFTDPQENIYPNAMTALGRAMAFDPKLKVMLNSGYFDLGTPYFEGVYEMQHLPMPAALQKNIEYKLYYSGHMVYLHPESLKLLHDNVVKFISTTSR
jgi:carboxypeptidase C (cathepsin A)